MTSWFRGNTHAHTQLCGHADSTPETVARWYLDHGYQFATLSEHNLFIDPDTVRLPTDRRDDFILVPGEELTSEQLHMTAFAIDRQPDHEATEEAVRLIDTWSRRVRAAGGVPVINHPNWTWQLGVDDIRPQPRCRLFELYNGHPGTNDEGDADHLSTEAIWDAVLTDGMVMYAVASDDAHSFADWGPARSNPGRGWVMVRSGDLTGDRIATAMDSGDFYASSGVLLHDVDVDSASYGISVDIEATRAEVARPESCGQALPGGYPAGLTVEFVGPWGKVVSLGHEPDASCARLAEHSYLRARVTWVEPGTDGRVGYRAWTQPVFQDGRLDARQDG